MASQQDEPPGDKIYGGYNFSAMRRELTLDKLWHSRTWGEIFRHFFTALIIVRAILTFFDMYTDHFTAKRGGSNYMKYVTNLFSPAFHDNWVHVSRYTTLQPEEVIQYKGIECFETDFIWGATTVLLISPPGAVFIFYILYSFYSQSAICGNF